MNGIDGWKWSLTVLVAAATTMVAAPDGAEAFCGAYVSGGDKDLFNNATHAAMMRHENTTVLSMQNNYEGPPEDFAMIVPTPVVLEKKNVKTLSDEVFSTIDTLTAPRLVEYWEQDPCYQEPDYDRGPGGFDGLAAAPKRDAGAAADTSGGYVEVEAKFSEGEYNIVVLSSNDSSALQQWLTDNNYNIPDGAGPYLEPYIQQGSKFFVAKVDTDEVEFTKDGQAVLSPLRFHYESDQFKLPVRLGLINSNGKQDLIVNILAKGTRYDVSNYPSATIPTNIEVVSKVKEYFPKFYRALFKETLKKNRKNGQNPIVTEYAWGAQKCDPCPFGMGLQDDAILTLGGDVLADKYEDVGQEREYRPRGDAGQGANVTFGYDWVITRLHTRYGKNEIGKDLVFEKADPIKGGRGGATNLSHDAKSSSRNNFQGRYIIKHAWDGPVECDNPDRGNWGGRHGGGPGVNTSPGETTQKKQGTDESDGPEKIELEKEVKEDVEPLGVETEAEDQDDGIEWTGNGNNNNETGGGSDG
ncbi:MAG: DUF2330 domain-containing protein, partial [Bradymonadaceae bacterium]